ncbi:MAG TPA: hypothetical protein VL326_11900 [Kofleriaceae bacterium]|nr:hypothetical protein [Kofleriaceae bacterium]
MAADTLRQLIDAGKSNKRLDELSSARLIGKVALQIHAAQQKAGAGKAVGPISPNAIKLAASGEPTFAAGESSSLGYSSPEQLSGSGDRRSDVFSLGAVLWEVLTYQRLFDAMNDAAVKAAVKEREITPPAEANANVPAELSAICMRALARNPADRYQSLKSMAVEIEEFLSEAGYEDNDERIAAYITQLPDAPARAKGGTQPPALSATSFSRPASASQPPPSILTAPPVEAVPMQSSGAALAAKLAGASSPAIPTGSVTGLPAASASGTAVGVPAAPAIEPVPLVPMPPVLPGQTPVRNDKSTISVAVPPQVKVATNTAAVVEAKHSESKPHALIVEDKPPALIVEDNPAVTSPGVIATLREPAKTDSSNGTDKTNGTPTVELRKPLEAPPVTAPAVKADDPAARIEAALARAEAALADVEPETQKLPKSDTAIAAELPKVEAKPETKPEAQVEAQPEAKIEAKIEAKADAKAEPKADAKADAKTEVSKRQSTAPQTVVDKKSAPHAAAAVSLGPAPRDSKGDVLAGWGWGTDKHNAIAPEGYAGVDDEDVHAPPDNKKTLLYVIGGGVAVAAMVTIIALVAGGSGPKKKSNRPVAAAQPTEAAKAEQPAPPPPPDPAATGSDTGSAATGSATDPAADQAAADKAAADQAAADKAAADKAAADQAVADKAAAEQSAADKKAQETLAAEQAAADKKAAAEKAAADKKAAAEQAAADKKAAADKLAADKKAAAELKAADKAAAAQALADKRAADKAAAEQKAAERKAAADKLAADKKAAQEKLAADHAAKGTTTTTAKTRPTGSTTTATKTVAKAETKKTETKTEGKVDVESAYRQGLQQFARGDTAGALASLRTSLAANPNYAPTWRGLGLVFEKMGEKEQARAAYKRYLQLAPGATDTEQIKGRLERLGS